MVSSASIDRPKRSRLPTDEQKAEIVTAALRLTETTSPDALTTEMIADVIGLTQPALFRHFPKKEMIWTAVAEKLAADMAAARAAAVPPGMAPPDAVLAIAVAQGVAEQVRRPLGVVIRIQDPLALPRQPKKGAEKGKRLSRK